MFDEHKKAYLFSELLARVQLVRYKAREKLKAHSRVSVSEHRSQRLQQNRKSDE